MTAEINCCPYGIDFHQDGSRYPSPQSYKVLKIRREQGTRLSFNGKIYNEMDVLLLNILENTVYTLFGM